MANFIEFKKQFTLLKNEYEQQEKAFLEEIFFYIADKSEDFYQNNLKEREKIKDSFITQIPLFLQHIVFSIDSSIDKTICLAITFNLPEYNLQINHKNHTYTKWKEDLSIHTLLPEFINHTVGDKNFSETLFQWLEQNDRKLKIIHDPIYKAELLNVQFERILGDTFMMSYEKHKLDSIIEDKKRGQHKIKI